MMPRWKDIDLEFAKWITFRWSRGYPFRREKPKQVLAALPIYHVRIGVRSKRLGDIIHSAVFVSTEDGFSSGCGVLIMLNKGKDAPEPVLFDGYIGIAASIGALLGYLRPDQVREVMVELNKRRKQYEQGGFSA